MLKFIGKRLLMLIPVVIGISFIIFSIMSLTPGDPAQMKLGESADPAAIEQLREEMGLNDPFLVRYGTYMINVLKGDFGKSYRTNLPVIEEIKTRFPVSLRMAFFGIGLSVVIGVPLGVLSAIKQYSILDILSLSFALLLTAVPAFFLGLLLLLVFSLNLGWLPATGASTWLHYILPTITLGASATATITRLTRSNMLEIIRQDYVRTAKAKGASQGKVIFKHVLRNAILPIVTVVGMNFGVQLGGTVVIESVFSMPGMGSLMITAVRMKDIPVVTATVMFVAVAIGLANLVVDILYAYIDPRIKSQYA
ncbi:MAG: ABC transporter permease [Oscillospiraceae bacterium]